MCLMGLKYRCGLVCPLSGMSGGGSVSGPFPPSRGAPIPWPIAPPSIFKAHHSNLCLRHHPAFSDPPASVSPGTCGYTGPQGWSRIIPASRCCHGQRQAAIQERMPPEARYSVCKLLPPWKVPGPQSGGPGGAVPGTDATSTTASS